MVQAQRKLVSLGDLSQHGLTRGRFIPAPSLLLQNVLFIMSLRCWRGQWTLLSLLYTLAPSPPGRGWGREML